MQVAVDLPNDFVGMLTQDVVAREMRMTYALALFKDARVTLAKAAEVAGVNIYEFIAVCKVQRIPVIDISRDELVEEMQSIGRTQ
jgi:predicted HTH domain antitoxin